MANSRDYTVARTSLQRVASTILCGPLLLLTVSTVSVSAFSPTRIAPTVPLRFLGRTDHKNGDSSTGTFLMYRETDEEDPDDRREEHKASAALVRSMLKSWQQRLFPPSRTTMSEQDKVDDYLEFLEKRYHRLHDSSQPNTKQFSVMDWLLGDSDNTASANTAEQQENALFALGVAELASDRLLQNLHITLQQEKEHVASGKARVIDAQFSTSPVVDNSVETKNAVGSLIEAGATVLSRLAARRIPLISYQSRQMEKVLSFSVKAATKGPVKAFTALWTLGGGKSAIALTFALVTSVLLRLIPLVQAVVKTWITSKQSP